MRKASVGLVIVGVAVLLLAGGFALSELSGGSGSGSARSGLTNPASLSPAEAPAIGSVEADKGPADSSGYSADKSLAPQATGAPAAQAGTIGGASASATAGGAGGNTPALPEILDRKIVRNATLELTVDDVAAAVQKVENAAQAAGGFVSGSNFSVQELPKPAGASKDEPPPTRQTATVTIRVPADQYASVIT